MDLLTIAIDSSNNLRYSCTVSGRQKYFDELHKAIDSILVQHNERGPFHWSKLRRNTRKSAQKDVCELINNSKLFFNVFEHKKPPEVLGKRYYLVHVPNTMVDSFKKWLEGRSAAVRIYVDDDYTVAGVKDSTKSFIEFFIRKLCDRLIGVPVTIRKNEDVKAVIEQLNGSVMHFAGFKSDRKLSKEIQLADIVLGYYLYDKSLLENKIFFRKI